MKIFEFNPEVGIRGDMLRSVKRATWVAGRMNDYDGHAPFGFGPDAEVTVHHDAGIGIGEDERSYRHPSEWICFCLGQWDAGDGDIRWEWIILPPKNEVKR